MPQPKSADFLAIWRCALNLPSHGDLTPDQARQWATKRGLTTSPSELSKFAPSDASL